MERATLPSQRVIEGTLATPGEKASAQGVRPPALLIEGEVVRLRSRLAWFGRDGVKLARHAAGADQVRA
jgi:siroheme synthase